MLATVRPFSVHFLCSQRQLSLTRATVCPRQFSPFPTELAQHVGHSVGTVSPRADRLAKETRTSHAVLCSPGQTPSRERAFSCWARLSQEHTRCALSPPGAAQPRRSASVPSSTTAAAGERDRHKQQEGKQKIRWKFRGTFKREKRFPTHTVYPLI